MRALGQDARSCSRGSTLNGGIDPVAAADNGEMAVARRVTVLAGILLAGAAAFSLSADLDAAGAGVARGCVDPAGVVLGLP